jgi:rhodanese-related sulfurtransferase
MVGILDAAPVHAARKHFIMSAHGNSSTERAAPTPGHVAEVNILKFVTDNIFLVGVALVSGAMLVWPAVRRGASGASVSTLQATLLINQQNALVLDVREAAEYEKGHLLNARNIPLGELEPRAGELEKHKAKPVIVVCDDGNRSGKTATALRKQGFEQVFTLSGGIRAWRQAGLPVEK